MSSFFINRLDNPMSGLSSFLRRKLDIYSPGNRCLTNQNRRKTQMSYAPAKFWVVNKTQFVELTTSRVRGSGLRWD